MSSSNENVGNTNANASMNMNASFAFNEQAAKERVFTGTSHPFWNPSDDFKGLIECYSEIRHVVKTGNMKNDVDVVDVTIVSGTETRKVTIKEENRIITETQKKRYENERFSLVLSKAVLKTKIEGLRPLAGKKIVVVGLGKRVDKKYVDYYVATEEQTRREGVVS